MPPNLVAPWVARRERLEERAAAIEAMQGASFYANMMRELGLPVPAEQARLADVYRRLRDRQKRRD